MTNLSPRTVATTKPPAILERVRHCRLVIHRLLVDGTECVVRFGTLVVAERDDGELDWEVVADSTEAVVIDMGRHDLELLVISGADSEGEVEFSQLMGRAVLVRFVDSTVVFRGDSQLVDFDPVLLE